MGSRLRQVRFWRAARWGPVLVLTFGYWADDPDRAIRVVTLALAILSVVALDVWDQHAPRLRTVQRCDCHAAVTENTERVATFDVVLDELRATVADWDASLRTVGMVPARRRFQVVPPSD